MFRDNCQLLTKLGICFTGRFDQYQTPNVKIKFFDLSIIIHTPVIFEDYKQLITFCLHSSKFNFCYAMLGLLNLHYLVNNPWYYRHRSLSSAFSGCLSHWDLFNTGKKKKVDTNPYLRVVFAHSKGKGHQAKAKHFFGPEAKVQRSIKKLKKCCIVKKIQMTWLEVKGIWNTGQETDVRSQQ